MSTEAVRAFAPVAPDADYETVRAGVMARLADPKVPTWTDHNAADPGVTLAEAAAFALADLHYRTATRDSGDWPMEVPGWLDDDQRSWHQVLPEGSALAVAAALAAPADPTLPQGETRAAALERLMRDRAGRGDARAAWDEKVVDPDWADLAGLPRDAVIDLLRSRLVRQVAVERTGEIEQALDDAARLGGTAAQLDARAAAALVPDLPLWPDEVARLVSRQRRRRTAQRVAQAAADLLAMDDAADWGAVQALLAADGLSGAEITAASAVHREPPGAMPERFEAADGSSTVWPPHPLQALTCEPVTAQDYARLARTVPGVRRAWALPGRLEGVGWDGRAVAPDDPDAVGALTLVIEPTTWPANTAARNALLRTVLRQAVGSEVDQPHPTWQDSLERLDPRRMLCDEVGAAMLQRCDVIVQAVLVAAPTTDRDRLIEAALTRIAEHFAAGRPESRTPPPAGPRIDGPWPRPAAEQPTGWRPGEPIRFTEVVQVLLADPAVLWVEDLALIVAVDGSSSLVPAEAGVAELGPSCVPVLAASQCVRVRLALAGECGGATP